MAFLDETGLAELWALIQAEDETLANNISLCPKYAVGSYTGTGKSSYSGNINPVTLTFGFKPKFLIICGAAFAVGAIGQNLAAYHVSNIKDTMTSTTWGNNSVSWYYDSQGNAQLQLNSSNNVYSYIAFGE